MSLLCLPPELLLKILSHLPYSDLQQLSLVSKHWQEIGISDLLLQKSQLIITSENVVAIKQHLESGKGAPERFGLIPKMSISVPYRNADLKFILNRIGTCVRSLHLNGYVKTNRFHCLMPNLEEIYMDLPNTGLQLTKRYPLRLNRFERLKSFHIHRPEMARTLLVQLRDPSTTVQLERLSVGSIKSSVANRIMHAVLNRHATTLTHIELVLAGNMTFPLAVQALTKLESVKLRATSHPRALIVLIDKIPSQAPVKYLSLSGLHGLSDNIIRFVTNKWWATLEHLELGDCSSISNETVDKLKVLGIRLKSLSVSYSAITNLELIWFGRNHTLTVLNLRSITCLKEISIKICAINLPTLEVLKLENCPEAVTNNSLPYIFGFLGRLRVLVLNHCHQIDNKGILGLGEWSFPISRLSALETLHLEGVRRITDEALMTAFTFPQLRDLRLSYCLGVSATGVKHLVANCPTIEKLMLASCLMVDDDAVLHIVSGLRRLRELDVNNCANITKDSVNYIKEHCQALKKLDLSGIDDLDLDHGSGNNIPRTLSPTRQLGDVYWRSLV